MDDVSARRFYVYTYLREDGSPYYIGKGTKSRSFRNYRRPKEQSRIKFVQTGLLESEAFAIERLEIAKYGRVNNGTGTLSNLTDGGEGFSGRVYTAEDRKKISERLRGRKPSQSAKRKMSLAKLGKPQSPSFVNARVTSRRYAYQITHPNGRVDTIQNLAEFARSHGLHQTALTQVAKGRASHHKGYLVEYLVPK